MDVLFLKNPKTGEVRRFFARASTPHDPSDTFAGWVSVDWEEWLDANADHELVKAAVARYKKQHGIEGDGQ